MKLAKISLNNFRGYKNETDIDVDDLTVLIGKNDAGKSTWLDALSIFFDEGSCKPEDADLNISATEKTFSITASFLPPQTMIIDTSNPINLQEEYLLDENGFVTIKKIYSGGKLKNTYLVAKHPNNTELKDLLNKTISDLKNIANNLGIVDSNIEGNKTKAATWRNAIRNSIENLDLKLRDILIDEKGGKEIWSTIKNHLPTYGLFQVDRNNQDGDSEVQDPFKIAIKEILKSDDVLISINALKEKVKTAYTLIASSTIEELRKINNDIANQLQPSFGDPNIDSAFKPQILTDTGIPLNKRGSGVRRLILLSFFKADMARRKTTNNSTNVIYAIEEPETSQHPEHQKKLIDALLALSEEESVQVIFTTHSPQLIKKISYKAIRYIDISEGNPYIISGEAAIAGAKKDLGELPLIDQGYLVCVEGITDKTFLRNIGKIEIFKNIFDISKASILPMNGGFINKWAEEHYLKDCHIREFHIYDRDTDSKYEDALVTINSWEGCSGRLTIMREIENYIHPDIINEYFNTDFTFDASWASKDIPQICSQASGKSVQEVKTIMSGLSNKMTEEYFIAMGTLEEVKSWFESIKDISQ